MPFARRSPLLAAVICLGLTARRVLKAPHGQEWLTLVAQWRAEPSTSIAFVADPRRTDLGDRSGGTASSATVSMGLFRAALRRRYAARGFGPVCVIAAWVMLDRGWALTAEVAGVTASAMAGAHKKPSIACCGRHGRSDTRRRRSGRHDARPATQRSDRASRDGQFSTIVSRSNPASSSASDCAARGGSGCGQWLYSD